MNNDEVSSERGRRSKAIVVGFIRLTFVATLSLMGCAGEVEPAPSGTSGALTHTLTWRQAPASEIVECHVFKLGNLSPIEIERIKFDFPAGSHHVHVYRSDEPEADGVADCSSGLSWPRWRLVVGAQTTPLDWKLPAGLSMPLSKNQQLLVQVHWLNTTQKPIDGKIGLSFFPARHPGQHVGVLFGIDKQVDMDAGASKRVSAYCPLPAGAQVIAMMGHFHTLGRAYSVRVRGEDQPSADGREIYRGLDENTLEFEDFTPPVSIGERQGLEYQCDFLNTKSVHVSWGPDTATQEHCNMAAYYYPAPDSSDGFCIKEAADVGTLTGLRADRTHVPLGEAMPLTVELGAPAAADTDLVLQSSDPTALQVPSRVRIPIHARTATVMARALRPSTEVRVSASLGTQTAVVPLAVRGLMLSELMVRPTANRAGTTTGPWIELANTGTMPIDLGRYRLSVGATGGATAVEVPLSGTLAPHGCLVVTAAAAPAMLGNATMMTGLPSDLGGGDAPLRVGLFEVDAPAAIDAVVMGTMAAAADGASIGMTAPGSSALRLTGDDWSQALVPTPGICELKP